MRKTWAIASKELRQAVRDPLSLVLLLGVPLLMLVLYGYAVNFDVKHVALAVQDRDKSERSRDLIASFINSGYFDLVEYMPPGAQPERITERRIAKAVLVIPEDFSKSLASGRNAAVQILLDGSDANAATTILGYASSIVADANITLLRVWFRGIAGTPVPFIAYEPRVWYNPELLSANFLVPGLIGFILMLTAVLSTALSIVREEERGTMEQLRTAPLGTGQLILGKCIPYLGISLLVAISILAAARFLFGVEIRGSSLDLLLATLLYLIGALAWGLLVSSVSDSQALAFQLGLITSMLPAILLSGFIFPIRSMPEALQWVTYAVPARYYLIVLRGIILKGAGLGPYKMQMLFLGIYALAVLSIASVRLGRKRA